MTKHYGHYINGKFVKPSSRKYFNSINPAKPSQVIGKFALGNEKDVDKAVKAAKRGYNLWHKVPAPKRGELLLRVAQLLRAEKERLAILEVREMGKVISEARGDVQEAIDVFEYMAGEGRRLFGHTTPSELRDKVCMTVRRPIGVVSLICPWNFPIAIPAWKIAPALICGNGIVIKPSSDTPLSCLELVKICEKAGIPKGVINFVTGPGGTVGARMIRHPDVRGVSFTGSRAVGQFVIENAGIKKVGLELGGKNPILIMEDADLNLAVEGVLFGAFGTTGQRCTATSRVIIHKKVKKEFEEILVKRIKKLKLGYGAKKGVDVGPMINQRAVDKTDSYVKIAKKTKSKITMRWEASRYGRIFL